MENRYWPLLVENSQRSRQNVFEESKLDTIVATSSDILVALFDDVRGKTLLILERAPQRTLFWAPPGTSNHILWHAGHALWLGDVLALEPATGSSELPAGWSETFGMNCRSPRLTALWPGRKEVFDLLERQRHRLRKLIAGLTPADLDSHPRVDCGRRTIAGCILHGLHDEANHQGEMYLLLKTANAQVR